jgi:hypothetical protein
MLFYYRLPRLSHYFGLQIVVYYSFTPVSFPQNLQQRINSYSSHHHIVTVTGITGRQDWRKSHQLEFFKCLDIRACNFFIVIHHVFLLNNVIIQCTLQKFHTVSKAGRMVRNYNDGLVEI